MELGPPFQRLQWPETRNIQGFSRIAAGKMSIHRHIYPSISVSPAENWGLIFCYQTLVVKCVIYIRPRIDLSVLLLVGGGGGGGADIVGVVVATGQRERENETERERTREERRGKREERQRERERREKRINRLGPGIVNVDVIILLLVGGAVVMIKVREEREEERREERIKRRE